MGLTATYERTDGEHENLPTAPFDIALVGVDLTPTEHVDYDEFSDTMSEAARNLES